MSNIGEYPVMSELKDEDKWFRFFTLKQLFYYGIALFLGIITTVLLYKVGLEIIGIVCIIINLIIAALLQATIPSDKYLIGGGMKTQIIVKRLFLKLLPENRIIYTKNYDESKEMMERGR